MANNPVSGRVSGSERNAPPPAHGFWPPASAWLLINHEADVNWTDFYYSPYIGVSRKDIEHLGMNPLGRLGSKKRSGSDMNQALA
ncbi:hypothetical protein JOE33_003650 [Pseudomonas sp. PvP027]|nr:hypothetical protein [Pseudomonas sp. PvP027]